MEFETLPKTIDTIQFINTNYQRHPFPHQESISILWLTRFSIFFIILYRTLLTLVGRFRKIHLNIFPKIQFSELPKNRPDSKFRNWLSAVLPLWICSCSVICPIIMPNTIISENVTSIVRKYMSNYFKF